MQIDTIHVNFKRKLKEGHSEYKYCWSDSSFDGKTKFCLYFNVSLWFCWESIAVLENISNALIHKDILSMQLMYFGHFTDLQQQQINPF